jgi:hypothetical protein
MTSREGYRKASSPPCCEREATGLLRHRNNSHRAVLFLNKIRYRYARLRNPSRPDQQPKGMILMNEILIFLERGKR